MSDIISGKTIKELLDKKLHNKITIDIRQSVTSTNTEMKKIAQNQGTEGCLMISLNQTAGKGRMGRTFYSPETTGVYMSLLLRPHIKPEESTLITTAAAVSVCESLEKMGVDGLGIKWVNDVYLDSGKVCGILTEAGFGASGDRPDYVVLGVGVNMYAPPGGFPPEISSIAGAVFGEEKQNLRNRFIAGFLNSFYHYYDNISHRNFVDEYRRRCFVIGRDVDVVGNGEKKRARVLGVDDNCGLQVQFGNGETAVLNSGEISVRVAE